MSEKAKIIKVLVNIHGAGKTFSDFDKPQVAALAKILGQAPAEIPCWYGDLSNAGPAVFAVGEGDALPPDAAQSRAELVALFRKRQKEIADQMPADAVESYGLLDGVYLVADLIQDVTGYVWTNLQFQTKVQELLDEKLCAAARDYDATVLVSHSLGTVVAYDVLRRWADRYKIAQFITMGCPLKKLVLAHARSNNLGAINGKTVPEWYNFYDDTDPVADAIGTAFPGYPIKDVFTNNATLPIESHDYWTNPNVLKIIADLLR